MARDDQPGVGAGAEFWQYNQSDAEAVEGQCHLCGESGGWRPPSQFADGADAGEIERNDLAGNSHCRVRMPSESAGGVTVIGILRLRSGCHTYCSDMRQQKARLRPQLE